MATGIVKWFDPEWGWGRITYDVEQFDVLFSADDVVDPGPPAAGQWVEFDLELIAAGALARTVRLHRKRGGPAARDLDGRA